MMCSKQQKTAQIGQSSDAKLSDQFKAQIGKLQSENASLQQELAKKDKDSNLPSSIFESVLTTVSGLPSTSPFNSPAICSAVNSINPKNNGL